MNASQTIRHQDLPALCAPLLGGYYGGRFRIGADLYANIVSGIEGQVTGAWNDSDNLVEGAMSYADGLANTEAMAAAGSALATSVRALRIGDFDDWHIGARDVVELTYRNFKPSTNAENMWRAGDNPSSVPPGFPYTTQSPLQTSAAEFQEGGKHALATARWYWTSTQYAAYSDFAWFQGFSGGSQYSYHKSNEYRARAVRRVLVIQ